MKKFQTLFAAFILVAVSAFALVPASPVGAAALDGACVNNADSAVCVNKDDTTGGLVGPLINTLLFIVGAISVVIIIIGGVLYVISGGNSGSVTRAKNTVTYAVVGLLVAFLAYAIVNWVFKLF